MGSDICLRVTRDDSYHFSVVGNVRKNVGNCLSIMIDTSGVRLRKNLGVESIAFEKVQQWIRDFPKKGLPFERGKILREESTGGASQSLKGR